jgi:transcriptional regulator/AAA ATPase-like protein
MSEARTVRDFLTQHAAQTFVGRSKELAFLSNGLETSMPPVSFVHGIAGIGKSRLLEAFTAQARARKASVLSLDCRQFEPTPLGFLRHLGSVVGQDLPSAGEACEQLRKMRQRVVIILDNYEVLRLLDTWLRQDFVPELPKNVHVILCGREAPLAAWLCTPGWSGLFRSLSVESLRETEAIELLSLSGIDENRALHINRFTRGHPLALTLAAATLAGPNRPGLEDLALHHVIEELARMYLNEISDDITRRALEAASVVRCATISLLRAMLPEAAAQDVYERLRSLPLVHAQRDGLQVHDSLQHAIALSLKASDPDRYLRYRRAAWYQLRTEVRTAPVSELWRYTADMIYWIENPVVREAFFPTENTIYSVEPARADDADRIFEIARKWDGPEAVRGLELCWKHLPQSFSVLRDAARNIRGFKCLLDTEALPPELSHADTAVANWLDHLAASPVPPAQHVLFLRRLLVDEVGEGPGAAQAAFFIDIKRSYMVLRPYLRRVYCIARDHLADYAPLLGRLGFQLISSADPVMDGQTYKMAMLDFGPSSVDGWLARLAAAELGVDINEMLDVEARELVIEGRRLPLTPLEFSLMRYLYEHEGSAISRESLLRDVWGRQYDVGSNVVDVVVRSIRKKLGSHADLIETVPGFGYRFRQSPQSPP